jgi:outer membrane immunogenic protein
LWNTNWLWRLEYLHYDFGNTGSNSSFSVQDVDSGGTNFTTGHLTVDAVRTGLSYKFN